MIPNDADAESRGKRLTWLFATALIATTLVAIYLTIRPPCPRSLSIVAGPRDGAYFEYATRYAQLLKKEGIELTVHESAGSVDNLRRLRAPGSTVSLALVQGGANSQEDRQHAVSLASLYLEPVWIFYRGADGLNQLHELAGGRIAMGPPGSGTRALAQQLFTAVGMLDRSASSQSITVLPLAGNAAADALEQGRLEAAVFVISPKSPVIKRLLKNRDISLIDLTRVDAYPPNFRFLSAVELHQGVLDIKQNIPHRTHRLLAANTNLVARPDLHPALVAVLLKTAKAVHESGGIFEEPAQYPSALHLSLPIHSAAKRYFDSGPSLLFRYLPFPLAAWLDQMKFLLLPLGTLILPLFKTVPPLYRWRIRSKIYRWYRVLREIDTKRQLADERTNFTEEIATLESLDGELADVSVPLSYMQEFYNLRVHVWFVLERLRETESESPASIDMAAAAEKSARQAA